MNCDENDHDLSFVLDGYSDLHIAARMVDGLDKVSVGHRVLRPRSRLLPWNLAVLYPVNSCWGMVVPFAPNRISPRQPPLEFERRTFARWWMPTSFPRSTPSSPPADARFCRTRFMKTPTEPRVVRLPSKRSIEKVWNLLPGENRLAADILAVSPK